MKATDVITRDHRAAEAMFETYKKANQEDRAAMEEKIFKALDTHEEMEDAHFYPALEGELADDESLVELEREQQELKEELAVIKGMEGDRSEAIKAAMEKVLAHAMKEEKSILSKAEEILGTDRLEELGEWMEPMSAVANEEK
jgi:hemerythrin superfamily protein